MIEVTQKGKEVYWIQWDGDINYFVSQIYDFRIDGVVFTSNEGDEFVEALEKHRIWEKLNAH